MNSLITATSYNVDKGSAGTQEGHDDKCFKGLEVNKDTIEVKGTEDTKNNKRMYIKKNVHLYNVYSRNK